MKITFSFVMCINRDQPWLDEAIGSVLRQDDYDFEFLIAANACSDALWEKLEYYAKGDCRIRLFRSAIGQLAFNLNLLADHSTSDYLVRMDADDICEPCRLKILRRALVECPVDILGSAAYLIDSEGKLVGYMAFPESNSEILRALITRTVFCHPTVVLRRQFLLEMRGYLGGFASEDTDLWLRARRAGARMRNLQEPLLRYRVHAEQSIGSSMGYAEVAAHWLREFLLFPSWYSTRGFAVAMFKALFTSRLLGVKRYFNKKNIPN